MRAAPRKTAYQQKRDEIGAEYKRKIDDAKKRLAEAHKNAQKLLDAAVDEYETERQSAYAIERRDILELHKEERAKDDAGKPRILKPNMLQR